MQTTASAAATSHDINIEPFAAAPIQVAACDLLTWFDLAHQAGGEDHDPGLGCDECEHRVPMSETCPACDAELVVCYGEPDAAERREGRIADAYLDAVAVGG